MRKYMMSVASAALVLTVMAGPSLSQEKLINANNSLALSYLKEDFGDAIVVNKIKNSISYCPDNTCEEISSIKTTSLYSLANYLYLYLYSPYFYLSDWKSQKSTKARAYKIISQEEINNCKKISSNKFNHCAMLHSKRFENIKVFEVRFDEGRKIRTPKNLK